MTSQQPEPRESDERAPDDADPQAAPETRLSNDPDPYPGTDVVNERPPGRGLPEEDPDPPLPG